MKKIEIAPAKINLWLKVLGKRDDGFHDIESLMVAVSGVNDRLTFEVNEGNGKLDLLCDLPSLSMGEDNLIIRAIELFKNTVGLDIEGSVTLEKFIPIGAGLGGGSSDAAATLNAVNALFGKPLSIDQLKGLGAILGSDVPFFIEAIPSLITGRGELLSSYTGELTRKPIVLIKPDFEVSSAWAYSRWEKSNMLSNVNYSPQQAMWGAAINDLEVPVFEKFLFLPALKNWLLDKDETETVLMSGSGSTMFAVCSDVAAAEKVLTTVKLDFGDDIWCKIVYINHI